MNKDQFTFADIEEAKNKYAAEAKERWGNTSAYKESKRREAKRTEAEAIQVMNETNEIFTAFAKSVDKSPSDPEVQSLVAGWQALITKYHYNCTDEILNGIADLYISDERFTSNMNRFGDGTAQFVHDAIKAYCAGK